MKGEIPHRDNKSLQWHESRKGVIFETSCVQNLSVLFFTFLLKWKKKSGKEVIYEKRREEGVIDYFREKTAAPGEVNATGTKSCINLVIIHQIFSLARDWS